METQITLFIMFATFASILVLAGFNVIRNEKRAATFERGLAKLIDSIPRMDRHAIRKMRAIVRKGSLRERIRQGFGARGSWFGTQFRKRDRPDEGRRGDLFYEKIRQHRLAFNQPEKPTG